MQGNIVNVAPTADGRARGTPAGFWLEQCRAPKYTDLPPAGCASAPRPPTFRADRHQGEKVMSKTSTYRAAGTAAANTTSLSRQYAPVRAAAWRQRALT